MTMPGLPRVPAATKIGMTPQGEIYGLSPQEIRVRSNQLFAALSLEPDGKKIGEFSKGMKRKAAGFGCMAPEWTPKLLP